MTTIEGTRLTAGEFEVGGITPDGLSPEGLMIYLQTRLTGLDDQINRIFEKQKKIEAVRKELIAMQSELDRLKSEPNNPTAAHNDPNFEQNIKDHIAAIRELDPDLANAIETDLKKQGNALYRVTTDGEYTTAEIDAGKTTIDGFMKQLEASAQLEMISLQSLMSARQTAVQLSTNLISALGETTRSIAANIGK